MRFEERLVALRKQKGLSQEKLAEAVGVSRQSVNKWENGLVIPGSEYLIQLSKLYGVTLDELVNEERELKVEPNGKQEPALPPEPEITDTKKLRTSPLAKIIIVAICVVVSVIAICVGIYSFYSREEGRDIVPIEDLKEREVDTSNWGNAPFLPLDS